MRRHFLVGAAALGVAGCQAGPPPRSPSASLVPPLASDSMGMAAPGTPDEVNIPLARSRAAPRAFDWRPWSSETFAQAKREGKRILVDAAAEWCHWCHVMDETTYRDPEIGAILRNQYIAIRVDIDERPDIEERYSAWGWPATVLLSSDAEELGKFRGYLPPADMKRVLTELGAAATSQAASDDVPLPIDALAWLRARLGQDLDDYYDEDQGGWGHLQKAPLGANVEVLLRQAHGDASAAQRALFTLTKERALIDPVWGGMSQYSAGATWLEPHFEKLMTVQAASIASYALGYLASGDASLLADARRMASYVTSFLTNPAGAFLVSQDADLHAHEPQLPFVDGHVYYAKSDAERRRLGLPRVDDRVDAFENGLGIAAFATLAEASRDRSFLDRARKAADVVLADLVDGEGRVRRKGGRDVRYLADAAALGFGLARLGEAAGETRYREWAARIAKTMTVDFGDSKGPALFEHTDDRDAAGVFLRRAKPLGPNVMAARLLASVARASRDEASQSRARAILAAVATPHDIAAQGRMLGDLWLGIDDVLALPK